jgi:hypothetical protein
MPTDRTDEHGGSLSKAQAPPPSSSHSSEGSPSSLIMARGRSRVRRISSDADPFSEENLRKRCVLSPPGGPTFIFTNGILRNFLPFHASGYHSLKSFDQTFHLEKRWKLVREMGSGAYGVVMSVRIPHLIHHSFVFSFLVFFPSFFPLPLRLHVRRTLFIVIIFFISIFKSVSILINTPIIRQLSCRRDLGRDCGDKDGHACIRKGHARKTCFARAGSPSALQ